VRSAGQLAALRRQIAQRRFDVVIHLAEARGWFKSLRDYFFFRACGIPKIIGVPWRRRDLQVERRGGRAEWEACRLLRRVAPLNDINLEEAKWWDLHLTPGELAEAETVLAGIPVPILAVSLGTKVEVNDWTEPNWNSLLRNISQRWPQLSLVLLGAAD